MLKARASKGCIFLENGGPALAAWLCETHAKAVRVARKINHALAEDRLEELRAGVREAIDRLARLRRRSPKP